VFALLSNAHSRHNGSSRHRPLVSSFKGRGGEGGERKREPSSRPVRAGEKTREENREREREREREGGNEEQSELKGGRGMGKSRLRPLERSRFGTRIH